MDVDNGEEFDGYGARPGQDDIGRLLEDIRTLSADGIERIATAWVERAGRGRHASWLEAERAGLHVIETTRRARDWDEVRNQLLGLTERGVPLIAWRSEHGEVGHSAENALLGAALGLIAGAELDARHRRTLLAPMADALPWLSSR